MSNTNEIAAALAKAQAAMEPAHRSANNAHFRNSYATLADVWDACREALTSNGIAVLQSPEYDPEHKVVTVQTTLLHTSGQSLTGRLSVPVSKPDAHGVGSAITYARRFALGAFVGVCPEDDDGNAAARPGAKAAKRSSKPDLNGAIMAAARKRAGVDTGKPVDEARRAVWAEVSAEVGGGKPFADWSDQQLEAAAIYLRRLG